MLPWHPPDDWWLIADPELNVATWTMPGHEPDVGVYERALAWEMQKCAEGLMIGDTRANFGELLCDAMLRRVLRVHRRAGIPAVSATFEDDCIVVHVARPAGHG